MARSFVTGGRGEVTITDAVITGRWVWGVAYRVGSFGSEFGENSQTRAITATMTVTAAAATVYLIAKYRSV